MLRAPTAGGLFVALAMAALGCGPPRPGSGAAFELPRPDLGAIDPAVREQLEEKQREVASILERREAAPTEIADAVGDLGRLYHSYALLSAADSCYRQTAAQTPDDYRWPYYLGVLEQGRGRWLEAAGHFERALELEAGDSPTLLRLAAVSVEAGDAQRAKQLYQRVRKDPLSAAAAFEGLARIAFDAGDPGGAVLHLEQALGRQPAASALHHRLAAAYRSLGDEEAAQRHRALAGPTRVSHPDPLAANLDRGALGVGRSLARGGVALAEGRLDLAANEYRRAVEQDPDDFSARLNLGLVLADRGDPEAELHLRQATALDPQSAVAHHALGRRLAASSEAAEARARFTRALELDPAYEAAHYHLGELEAGEGRHREALVSFTAALEVNPQSRASRVMRALSLLELDRPRDAAEDLRIALEGAGADEAAIRLRLGEALQRMGDIDQALLEYERAAAGGLDARVRASAELSAGNLLLARGESDAARVYLEAAVDSDPALAPAHFNLAGSLASVGETDLAVVHYRRSAELDPEHLPSKFHLGRTLLEMGRSGEARRSFAEVLAIDPWHEGSLLGRASAQVIEKSYAKARAGLERALLERPESVPLAHALARLLATCPDPAVRDGERAAELALSVMSVDSRFEHAETVAMAMAAAGRFAEAVSWQLEVLRQAQNAPRERIQELEAHLGRYQSGLGCCG